MNNVKPATDKEIEFYRQMPMDIFEIPGHRTAQYSQDRKIVFSLIARIDNFKNANANLMALYVAVDKYERVFGLENFICSECRERCELEIYPSGECECCCHDISRIMNQINMEMKNDPETT